MDQCNAADGRAPFDWAEIPHDEAVWHAAIRSIEAMLAHDDSIQSLAHEVKVGGATTAARATMVLAPGALYPICVVVLGEQPPHLPGVDELQRRFRLTAREAEVALLLAERRSNKEVARALGIAMNTAWRHTDKVLMKLGVGSRKDVLRALAAGHAGGSPLPLPSRDADPRLRSAA